MFFGGFSSREDGPRPAPPLGADSWALADLPLPPPQPQADLGAQAESPGSRPQAESEGPTDPGESASPAPAQLSIAASWSARRSISTVSAMSTQSI